MNTVEGNYDYLIVGAGSAGCVVASKLCRAGFSVLLIEAGGSDRRLFIRMPIGYGKTFFDPAVNWCYQSESESSLNNRSSYWPRGKVVGGSSSINAMVYYRGQANDFDDWAKTAGPAWSWKNVRSAFPAIERIHHADGTDSGNGPLRVTDPGAAYHRLGSNYIAAANALGFEHNPCMFEGEGVGRYLITAHRGRRFSAADAFLHPVVHRARFDIVRGGHVSRILFDGQRAIGVEWLLRGRTLRSYCQREVIVCGGAINSPQLLQLSGIGPAQLLSRLSIPMVQNLPVGEGLQDHLATTFFYRSRVATLNNALSPWWGKLWAGICYAGTRRGPLALGVNQYGGFVRSSNDLNVADLQLYFNPITYTRVTSGSRDLMKPDPYPGFLLSFQPCRPMSRGRIEIESIDPLAAPRILPNYLKDDADLDAVCRGTRLIARLANQEPMRAIIERPTAADPSQMNDRDAIDDFRQRADTVYHPVGTCAMGIDPKTSVVDPRLKVHHIDALRVVDASVFPNVTSGNTNAPTLMVAWKAADMIIEDAAQSPHAAKVG
ncbi:MAG: choline dehydrogenase [marine bacterium B5-7]|nr:MAG: choline dehydrogenase [marine bacterium B5-7]